MDTYIFEFTEYARRQFNKLPSDIQRRIKGKLLFWQSQKDPLLFAKSLTEFGKATYRYRVGDYRIICGVEKNRMVVLVLSVGHRSTVYKH